MWEGYKKLYLSEDEIKMLLNIIKEKELNNVNDEKSLINAMHNICLSQIEIRLNCALKDNNNDTEEINNNKGQINICNGNGQVNATQTIKERKFRF